MALRKFEHFDTGMPVFVDTAAITGIESLTASVGGVNQVIGSMVVSGGHAYRVKALPDAVADGSAGEDVAGSARPKPLALAAPRKPAKPRARKTDK